MQNIKKTERIARNEGKSYHTLMKGMLTAYRATPRPATNISPYELTFERKMQIGIAPEVLKKHKADDEIRKRDMMFKLK